MLLKRLQTKNCKKYWGYDNMDSTVKKIPVLKRFPPGDKWIEYDEPNEYSKSNPPTVYPTLTAGLDFCFRKYNSKKFIVDAEDQIVYIIEEEQSVQQKTDKYSIYDE